MLHFIANNNNDALRLKQLTLMKSNIIHKCSYKEYYKESSSNTQHSFFSLSQVPQTVLHYNRIWIRLSAHYCQQRQFKSNETGTTCLTLLFLRNPQRYMRKLVIQKLLRTTSSLSQRFGRHMRPEDIDFRRRGELLTNRSPIEMI